VYAIISKIMEPVETEIIVSILIKMGMLFIQIEHNIIIGLHHMMIIKEGKMEMTEEIIGWKKDLSVLMKIRMSNMRKQEETLEEKTDHMTIVKEGDMEMIEEIIGRKTDRTN
jgi:hypothetical protein